MVDLPRIGVDQNVVNGPQSSVSGAEIQSAFGMLAQGLANVGQTFKQNAVDEASAEGAGAVYRDEEGNIKFNPRPNYTEQGRAFNKSARHAALAQASNATREALTKLRLEAKGDVASFDQMADEFLKRTLDNQPDNILRGPLKAQVQSLISEARLGLIEDQTQRDLVSNEKAIKGEIAVLDNELAALAKQGGTSTKEYAEKRDAVKALYAELTDNPLFKVGQREVDVLLGAMETRHTGEFIVGRVQSIYATDGLKKAQEFVEQGLNDPDLPLSPKDRRRFQGIAKEYLNGLKAENAAVLKETKAEARTMMQGLREGKTYDEAEVFELADRLAAQGDPAGSVRLSSLFDVQRETASFASKPDAEQAEELSRARLAIGGADLPIITATQAGRVSGPVLDGVQPQLLDAFKATQNAFGKSIPIVSGFRDAETNRRAKGAKKSKHLDGSAIDIDVSGLSKAERRRLIEIASANGITGIGVYNNSLHFDTGSRRAWGPSHGAGSVPMWAQSAIMKHMAGVSKGGPPARAMSVDQIMPFLLNQESGGRQFAKDGTPLQSSAGAIGIAQVMPSTAEEAARLAGLEWSAEKYMNDPKYNEALGRAYLQKQLEVNNGDMAKALAAYNGGPGALEKAIKRGGADWLRYMPAETRNYVRNILSKAGQGMPGGSDPRVLGAMRKEVAQDARNRWSKMQEGLKKGFPLSPEDTQLLVKQVNLVGDQDFADEVNRFLNESRLEQFPGLTPLGQQADIDQTMAGGVTTDEMDILSAKQAIYARTVKMLDEDPIGLVAERQLYSEPVGPLDFSTPETTAKTLQARQRVVGFTEDYYDREGIGALRPAEVDAMAKVFAGPDANAQGELLGTLAGSLQPDTYMSTIKQLAGKTAPPVIVAGALMNVNPEVAQGILRGRAALQQNPKLAPKEDAATVDVMLAEMPMTAFAPEMGEAYNSFADAARARYADLSLEAGDQSGQLNADRWSKAVNEVTGGFVEWNGKQVVAPTYGMAQDAFENLMSQVGDADILDAVDSTGRRFAASDFREMAVLTSVGDGKYLVQINSGFPASPYATGFPYLMSKTTGKKFVLDLSDGVVAKDKEASVTLPSPKKIPEPAGQPPGDTGKLEDIYDPTFDPWTMAPF